MRYTTYGGQAVEDLVGRMLGEAATALTEALAPADYRSVILIGGYGRGEGGVVVSEGVERPHNNLDFLVISRRGVDPAVLTARAREALRPLIARHRLGMDVGVIPEHRLAGAPCLVMWHDMRFGHRVLLGDREFVASLERFRPEAIVASDVRNLLVNRGTLLVINDLLLAKPRVDDQDRRTVIRHAAKTIIGYGDALLFFLGDYHWSYLEKQRRMQTRPEVPPAFRRLYDRAVEFRFRPAYQDFEGYRLPRWNRTLRESLSAIHLECERLRLGLPGLTWAGYPQAAFRASLTEAFVSPRGAVRRLRALGRRQDGVPVKGLRARIGAHLSPPRDRLPLLFPGVAYPAHAPEVTRLAARALGRHPEAGLQLQRAYLAQWGVHGDANFFSTLAALGLSLAMEAA